MKVEYEARRKQNTKASPASKIQVQHGLCMLSHSACHTTDANDDRDSTRLMKQGLL